MTSRTFDLGFDQSLEYFIGGWTFVIKDYNNEILKINNHVHLTTFKKLVRDLYGGLFVKNELFDLAFIKKKQENITSNGTCCLMFVRFIRITWIERFWTSIYSIAVFYTIQLFSMLNDNDGACTSLGTLSL